MPPSEKSAFPNRTWHPSAWPTLGKSPLIQASAEKTAAGVYVHRRRWSLRRIPLERVIADGWNCDQNEARFSLRRATAEAYPRKCFASGRLSSLNAATPYLRSQQLTARACIANAIRATLVARRAWRRPLDVRKRSCRMGKLQTGISATTIG
jgi:hypothetical protein